VYKTGGSLSSLRQKTKKYTDFQRPEIVVRYNEGIEGVYKYNHLPSFYRFFIRSIKWILRLITNAIDVFATISWIERKKAKQLEIY